MRPSFLFSCLVGISQATVPVNDVRNLYHNGEGAGSLLKRQSPSPFDGLTPVTSKYLNDQTPFAVNGKAIPDVPLDAGESYSGLLPTSDAANETKKLFFWFWPSKNQSVDNEIVIWLNGGPGSSSLFGFLQELGPFKWAPGTAKPYRNTWTPTNLTNVVWIEYPVGVGYTEGPVTATSEEEIAADFIGFWKNFMTLFSMQNRKVYIMGESYAGYYTPYIGAAMLDAANTTYWDFRGAMLISPLIVGLDGTLQASVGAASFIAKNNAILDLEEPYVDFIYNLSKVCGYDDYLSKYLVYPPVPGPLPFPFHLGEDGYTSGECDARGYLGRAASYMNACIDVYNILNSCPPRSNVLRPPDESGDTPYFNRADVKIALHVPKTTQWHLSGRLVFANSTDRVKQNDNSFMPTIKALPQIIEASKRTIIIAGEMDTVVLHTGVELGIQNMTWNGAQGFQNGESVKFTVAPFNITGISPYVLAGRDGALYNTSVAQKMSWASKRTTTRVEDVAYSLMGLFGVHMPMLYGEGDNAFKRLQEEILRSTDDHTIFAWRESEGNPAQLSLRSGVLANSPAKFAHSGKFIVKAHSSTRSTQPASVSSMGIRLQLPISDLRSAKCNILDLEKQANVRLAYLNCFDSVTDQQVGIYVEAAPISDSSPSSFTVQRAVPFFLQVGSFLAFPGDRYLNQKNARRSEVRVPKELSDCHAVLWSQSLLSQHNSDKHPFRSKYMFQLSKRSQDSGYRILDLWPRERCFDSYRDLDEAFQQTFTLPSGRNAIVGGAWIAFPKSVGGSFVIVTKTVHGNLTSNVVVPTDAGESLEQVARTWNNSSDHVVAEIPGKRASISVQCRRQLFREFAFYLVDVDV
ncbi:hypothetical protein IFR05_005166 [Cadophora sp. M221]|nr:hypothetical protein IFR05_005166 [Cadophora sp. M221]